MGFVALLAGRALCAESIAGVKSSTLCGAYLS
jgi:hypothetical protein